MAIVPFVDTKLEDRVLRHLLINEKSSDEDSIKIAKNAGYYLNIGVSKDTFYSTFKQWLSTQIVGHFIKFSESISLSVVLELMRKQYPEKSKFEKNEIILDRIFNKTLDFSTFKPLLEQLCDKYRYRSLYQINLDVHNKLKEDYENDNTESMVVARNTQEKLSKVLLATDRFRMIEEDIFHDIERDFTEIDKRRANPELYKGITTGFKEIDQATGGWINGELSVILGRPGQGKSVLLLNFGYHAYKERNNVIYITIEMPIEQIRRRFCCRLTGIKYDKVKMPEKMSSEEYDFFKKTIRETKEKFNNFFYIVDAPQNCDVNVVESKVIAFENTTGKKADLIIVDPIYLMKPSDRRADDPVGAISWDLKILARKLNLPFLVASQFNRESHKRHQHGKGVDTADAAFSDKLGNNSDNMIGITGDNYEARLSFPKTRDSKISDLYFKKDFDCMRFEIKKLEDHHDGGPKKDTTDDDEDY